MQLRKKIEICGLLVLCVMVVWQGWAQSHSDSQGTNEAQHQADQKGGQIPSQRTPTTKPTGKVIWHYELPRQRRELVGLGKSVKGKRVKVSLYHPGEWKREGVYWRYEIISRFVKSANYATLFLSHQDVLQRVGSKPWKTLEMVVDVHDYKLRIYRPKDPHMSAPLGGFRFHELFGRIDSVQVGR